MMQVAQAEGLHLEQSELDKLILMNGNDVRQVLNAMQMWSRDQKALATGAGGKGGKGRTVRVTDADLRTMAKDPLMRLNASEATSMLFNPTIPLERRSEGKAVQGCVRLCARLCARLSKAVYRVLTSVIPDTVPSPHHSLLRRLELHPPLRPARLPQVPPPARPEPTEGFPQRLGRHERRRRRVLRHGLDIGKNRQDAELQAAPHGGRPRVSHWAHRERQPRLGRLPGVAREEFDASEEPALPR